MIGMDHKFRPPPFSEIVLAVHPDGPLPVGAHPVAGEGRQQDEDGDHLDHKPAREGTQQGQGHVRSFTQEGRISTIQMDKIESTG